MFNVVFGCEFFVVLCEGGGIENFSCKFCLYGFFDK